MKIAKKITELIGNTPLVEIGRFSESHGLTTPLIAKVEAFNPGGSAKDRVALAMIEDAERKGLICDGATIIEPTSGNTGVGLAMVAAVKGYKVILTMPETMSIERRRLLKAYGAELVLTDAGKGMSGAIAAAEDIHKATPNSIILQQFDNPANPLCHYSTTANEIWQQTDGNVDVFVAGVGTGGTLSGVGKRLKELNPDIYVVAVEPAASPVLSGGKAALHNIQGIGANFIPANYNNEVVDEIISVDDNEAAGAAQQLARQEGLLVGISSGAATLAAASLATRPEFCNKRIVVLLPDTGERYLSGMNLNS